jgi:hypothetical protein
MTFDQRMAAAKPYITGFIVGLIAAPIIGFSAGWVSTSGARTTAVEDARVETLAGFCSATATRMAVAQSTDLATLKGYDNRAKREELVKAAMADIQVPEELVTKVTNGCNRTLA